MNRIVAFYKGENVHPLKYTIQEIWKFGDRQIEGIHSFIQWLFPLDKASANNLDAPILTEEDIETFRTDIDIRNRIVNSLKMMLKYYGFELIKDGTAIVKSGDFEARSGWIYPSNHNYLRVTRILECLMLLHFKNEAEMLFSALKDLYRTHSKYVGPISFGYWCRAVGQRAW